MRAFLQTLFFYLLVSQICFGQWVKVGLTDINIQDIAVQDSIIFAVTLDSGKVYRSIDSGTNWTMIVDSCARDIAISPTGKVFMVKDTALYYSLNNGDTWIYSDIMEQIDDSLPCNLGGYTPRQTQVGPNGIIFCYVAQRGPLFANAGWEDYFGISTDDGLTWSTPVGFSDNRGGALFDFRNQFALTYGILMHSGSVGNYLSFSSDYGMTWEVIAGPEGASIAGIFSNGNIILSGPWNLPGIQISTDMCSTWTQISIVSGHVCLSYSIGLEEGILVSTDSLGSLFLFSDEGDSLGSVNAPSWSDILALTLDNTGYLYASTATSMMLASGGLWRRPLAEIITSVENETTQPINLLLSQNYPNPFNPSTKIKYSVPQSSQVQIKVFDVLGNEVETLVNVEKPIGTYELTWYATNLPSGVYFYQLKAGSFVETKKMILLK